MGISIGNPQIFTGSGAVPGSTDSDAIAFVTSASITNPPVQDAIYRLVYDLKSASLWDKINVAYPLVSNLGGAFPGVLFDANVGGGTLNFLSSSTAYTGSEFGFNPPVYLPGTYTEGIKYIETLTTSSVTHSIRIENSSFQANTVYTLQATLHLGTLPRIKLEFDKSESIWGEESVNAIFDLATGTVASSGSTTTASLQPLGQDWYRASITGRTSESIATTTGNGFITFVTESNTVSYIPTQRRLCFIESTALAAGIPEQASFQTQGTYSPSSFSYNLKDPRPLSSSNYISFTGGTLYSVYGVYRGAGNTFFSLSSSLTTASYHVGIYTRKGFPTGDGNEYVIGATSTSPRNYSGQVIKYSAANQWNEGPTVPATPTASFEVLSVINNTGSSYSNGITLTSNVSPVHTQDLPEKYISILARNEPGGTTSSFNPGNPSQIPLSFVSMGQGLTQPEVVTYNTIVERFQRALNRSMIV